MKIMQKLSTYDNFIVGQGSEHIGPTVVAVLERGAREFFYWICV